MAVLPIPVFGLPGRLAIVITTLIGRRSVRLGVLWIVSHRSTRFELYKVQQRLWWGNARVIHAVV